MASVSAPARRRPASAPSPAPVERHGTCRLTLKIGETEYRLRPFPPAPGSGLKQIWTLRKIQPDPLREPVAYAIATDGREAKCTCPDHEINGSNCKHIMALVALGLIKVRRPRPARPAPAKAPVAARSSAAIPEGWEPGGAAGPARPERGPVAEGFARASRRMVADLAGAPEPEEEGFLCAYCGDEFDPAESRDPHFCAPCAQIGQAEGGAL
jgi:SWIM zinc finger